ncbi:MAG: sodium/proton antiporter NhaB [Steroidobacteraceae bacterium]
MPGALGAAFWRNFLGGAPDWYKWLIAGCLVANPVLLALAGPVAASWAMLFEFIVTLMMALRCYPLQPGGLIAIEAALLGLVTPGGIQQEIEAGLPVILLLMFMVAGIFFLREMLVFTFTRLLVKVRSDATVAFLFVAIGALLSAFLDALTVLAVMITVAGGFYAVYHRVASGKAQHAEDHDHAADAPVHESHRSDLDGFRAYLCGLMMHGAVGTTIGGVCTLVGEPQNLLIGQETGWNFVRFAVEMAPVTVPTVAAGLVTCLLVEKLRWFGYGARMPATARQVLTAFEQSESAAMTPRHRQVIIVQAIVALLLVVALALHVAEIGVIGLMIIVLATAFTGVVDEHRLGKAFEAALPFTALLVVFFAIVGMIHQQHLFTPFLDWVLRLDPNYQPIALFGASGFLSTISDNVFVATIYISQAKQAFLAGSVPLEQFEAMAVAINTGTNIPSIATPNGQAAFLFLLTSALAPLIRLSYFRMVWMALPYVVTMTAAAAFGVLYLL